MFKLSLYARQIAGRRVNDPLRRIVGLIGVNEINEKDIFICGYPKSGNTWFQSLVAGVAYGIELQQAPNKLLRELVPSIHTKRNFRRISTPGFFQSHFLPQPCYRRIVYLLRDGRDAMVSYYHYLAALYSKPIDFLSMVRDGRGVFPGKWRQHVEAYQQNPYGAEMLTIKYEDLSRDVLTEMRRFCEFAGIHRDDAALKQVIGQCSFENMKNKGKTQGVGRPLLMSNARRGKVGSYQDEMPPEVLQAFMADAAPTLARCGYI